MDYLTWKTIIPERKTYKEIYSVTTSTRKPDIKCESSLASILSLLQHICNTVTSGNFVQFIRLNKQVTFQQHQLNSRRFPVFSGVLNTVLCCHYYHDKVLARVQPVYVLIVDSLTQLPTVRSSQLTCAV